MSNTNECQPLKKRKMKALIASAGAFCACDFISAAMNGPTRIPQRFAVPKSSYRSNLILDRMKKSHLDIINAFLKNCCCNQKDGAVLIQEHLSPIRSYWTSFPRTYRYLSVVISHFRRVRIYNLVIWSHSEDDRFLSEIAITYHELFLANFASGLFIRALNINQHMGFYKAALWQCLISNHSFSITERKPAHIWKQAICYSKFVFVFQFGHDIIWTHFCLSICVHSRALICSDLP